MSNQGPVSPFLLALGLCIGMAIGYFLLHPFERLSPSEQKLYKVLRSVENNYVDAIALDSIVELSLTQVFENLDPHSHYFNLEESAQEGQSLTGELQGIGIEYRTIEDSIVVFSVLSESPAETYGLQRGDILLQADTFVLSGEGATDDPVSAISGIAGTQVALEVMRDRDIFELSLPRKAVPVSSVPFAFLLRPSTGYLNITTFASNTGQFWDNGVEMLRDDFGQYPDTIILDLRGNTGGYIRPAIHVASEFLRESDLISYSEGAKRSRKNQVSERDGVLINCFLYVLVDGYSASASELIAGCVKDRDMGVIVGEETYGKGLLQERFVYPDGTIARVTTGRYYTPIGRFLQRPYGEQSDVFGYYTDRDTVQGDTFRTQIFQRPVFSGIGVQPDILVPETEDPSYFQEESAYFYALSYVDRFARKLIREQLRPQEISWEALEENIWEEYTQQLAVYTSVKDTVGSLGAQSKSVLSEKLKQAVIQRLDGNKTLQKHRLLQDAAIQAVFQDSLYLNPRNHADSPQ